MSCLQLYQQPTVFMKVLLVPPTSRSTFHPLMWSCKLHSTFLATWVPKGASKAVWLPVDSQKVQAQ